MPPGSPLVEDSARWPAVAEPALAESVDAGGGLEAAFAAAAPPPPPPPPQAAMAEAVSPAPQVPMEAEPAHQEMASVEDLAPPESADIDIGPEPDFDPIGSVDMTASPSEEDLHILDDFKASEDSPDEDGPEDASNTMDDLPDLGPDFASDTAEDDEDDRETDLSDLPDGDDDIIPDVFAHDDDRYETSKTQRGWGRVVASLAVILVVTLGGLGTAAWFWRIPIVKHYEQADALYRFFGIPVNIPGLGLSFRDVTGERVLHGDVDTLVVRGFIVNISSIPRIIPFVQLSLFDGTDQLIQSIAAQAPVTELAEGNTTGFRIQLENPSASARRFKVDWASGSLPTDMVPTDEVQY